MHAARRFAAGLPHLGASRRSMASTPSFMRGLYSGQLHPDQVFPFPDVMSPDNKESLQAMLDPVQQFLAERNDPAKNDEAATVPDEVTQGLRELGLFGLQVPTDLDGLGLSNTAYARLVEVIGGEDLGLGIFLGAHQSIGFKGILLVGTEEQRNKYLPKLATGEHIAAFCLTEPRCANRPARLPWFAHARAAALARTPTRSGRAPS